VPAFFLLGWVVYNVIIRLVPTLQAWLAGYFCGCATHAPAIILPSFMKAACLLCVCLFPLAATAQKLQATTPPITYYVGLTKAPLYRSAADTAGKPSRVLFSQAEAVVVGQFSPRWVVVKQDGFLYLTPAQKLVGYDPADATPLPLDPSTQHITYEGVVTVPGVSQSDLYKRAATWIAGAYSQGNATGLREDLTTGVLSLQGARPVAVHNLYEGVMRSSYAGVVRHTLTIYVKDGRYKYVLTNLTHDAVGTPNMRSGGPLEQERSSLFGYAGLGSHKPWTDMKVEATRDARHLMAELRAAMTLQPVDTKPAKDPHDF
jgi:hypothetical protein